MSSRAPQPPFSTNSPHPPPIPMSNPPTDTNYFGPSTPKGPPPPQWAPGPPPCNAGQLPGSRPPNSRPPRGWSPAMDNFPPHANQPLGQRPPAQLNTTDLYEAPELLDANLNNLNNVLNSVDNQEALCTSKIWNRPWIDIPEETQKSQQKDGACILCGEQGHFIRSCSKQQLQDINPNIDWQNLTMQFSGSKASLAATIPLRLQPISDLDVSNPSTSTSRATQSPSTSNSDLEDEENMTPPQSNPIKS
ncbi:hypothetical protein E4T56_gene12790 [Termitomyces sp. T112]|nr:hypothetical protein E4T56_gene12790 [Termitomyces sp. T112]